MPTPEDLAENVKKENFVAVVEMMICANEQRCDTPESAKETEGFLHILQALYKEQTQILTKIKEAGGILQAKLKNYENRKEIFKPEPVQSSLEDL